MKKIAMVGLGLVWLVAARSFAADSPFKEKLSHVPAAELPAKAAALIKDTKARDREAVTLEVVKVAVALNPAAAPAIVGAISRSVPDVAALAAGTAAAEQPKQAAAIARAAAAAAPSKAGKIVVSVCRAVPNDYRNIAVAVAQAVPGSGKEILSAVAAALPDLKPGIEGVLARYGLNAPSVAFVLDPKMQAPDLGTAPSAPGGVIPSPLARGPAIGPPFLPLSGTPTNVTPGTSGNVPPGDRGGPSDYSQP